MVYPGSSYTKLQQGPGKVLDFFGNPESGNPVYVMSIFLKSAPVYICVNSVMVETYFSTSKFTC